MVSHIRTVAFRGIEALSVEVQVQLSGGVPGFSIVGLADKAVAESRERVRSALSSLGLSLPAKRITVNLAPADLQKEGSHFDLPIGLGVLVCMDVLDAETVGEFLVLGELGLDGRISEVAGILPASMHAVASDLGIICPAACGSEAMWAGDLNVVAASHLLDLVNHLRGKKLIATPLKSVSDLRKDTILPDLSDIKGQEGAKRVLEIAAAGGHNLLMCGPPGAGKSMLAARLPSILPILTASERLELSMIQSVAGLLHGGISESARPYRDPHHSASMAAMVGGGSKAKPGEISLAHGGVLFLDELPEFQRVVLEALRQPLESGTVAVARANMHISYPAKFQFVAAMNPCRCGYLGDDERSCSRAPKCGEDYRNRLSGPLLDRVDLHIEVPGVTPESLDAFRESAERSREVRARVIAARDIQYQRLEKLKEYFKDAKDAPNLDNVHCNADAEGKVLECILDIDKDAYNLALQFAKNTRLSARAFHRTLRVTRTIADLAASANITVAHIQEALNYRYRYYR